MEEPVAMARLAWIASELACEPALRSESSYRRSLHPVIARQSAPYSHVPEPGPCSDGTTVAVTKACGAAASGGIDCIQQVISLRFQRSVHVGPTLTHL